LTVNTQLIARKVPKEIDQHLAKETSKIRNAHKLFDSLTFIQFFMDPFHTVYRDADDVPWQVKYLRHSRRLEICEPLKAVEKPRATSKVAAIYLKKFS